MFVKGFGFHNEAVDIKYFVTNNVIDLFLFLVVDILYEREYLDNNNYMLRDTCNTFLLIFVFNTRD